MTTLHLGVVEFPYSEPAKTDKKTQPEKGDNARTTGEVAGYLEDKYHVMEHFFQAHGPDIVKALETSIAGALEDLLMGAPARPNVNEQALSTIKKDFSKFLSSKEMDGLGYPGVPTAASLKGVNHRMKNKKGTPGRPSFIDTGLYETSFKAWID